MKENYIGQVGYTSPQDALEDTPFAYYKPNPTDAHPMTNVKSTEKYCSLEEGLKMVEGFNAFGVDALDICLVLEWLFPPKFKEPLANVLQKNGCLCLQQETDDLLLPR